MNDRLFWRRLVWGAAAGAAGTMVIQVLLQAHQKWAPRSLPPFEEEPGRFMVAQAEQALPRRWRRRVPEKAEAAAGNLLGLGYGMTFGALYATARPQTRCAVLDGAILGVLSWAVGYLGWLPGLHLMRPIWKQKPTQIALPVAEHAAYGLATLGAYQWLKRRGVKAEKLTPDMA